MGSGTNVSYRFAVLPSQGVGFSKNTGTDWIYPETQTGFLNMFDSDGQRYSLVLDKKAGKFYNIATRESFTGSNKYKAWRDKCELADPIGSGGTAIAPVVMFPEDRGEFEHYYIEHLGSHIYVRPEDETDGYQTGLEVDVSIFKDGEPTTQTVGSDDIIKGGEVTYDRQVHGNRLQTRVDSNRSQIRIVGRQQYYIAKDIPDVPSDRITDEGTHQTNLEPDETWITRGYNLDLNRVSNADFAITHTAATGPDNKSSSAIDFTSGIYIGTYATSCHVVFWSRSNISSMTYGEGSHSGNSVSLTQVGSDFGQWQLYVTNDAAYSYDGLYLNPSGSAGTVFDIRIYSSGERPSTDALTYLYNDVTKASGEATLPYF